MTYTFNEEGTRRITATGSPARSILILLAFALLAGCSHFSDLYSPKEEKALADVVDAVQFALDMAAQDKVWEATTIESEHWTLACKKGNEASAEACYSMLEKAQPLCQSDCPNGNCNVVAQRRCEVYATGAGRSAMCSSLRKPGAAIAAWCQAADICVAAQRSAAGMCASAELVQLPELSHAELTLAVERNTTAGAGLNFLVVSFNKGRTETSSNSITMTLKPRNRSKLYGSVELPVNFPPERVVSKEAQALAGQLASLIKDAVKASVKEYDPKPDGSAVVARAPMLLAELAVSFSLTVDNNGSIGIKKAWNGIGAELGAGSSTKRANTLTIKYARK